MSPWGEVDPLDSLDFWEYYRRGRIRYMSHAGRSPEDSFTGIFGEDEFKLLLPGIIVPRAYRRAEYLTNLLWDDAKLCLDVFSARTSRPLFRHYFDAL